MAERGGAGVELEVFSLNAYEASLALWKRCPGVGLSSADEREPIAAFLDRNPGLSFTAWEGERLLGTSLCGCDGRRGYLYHVAVEPESRRRGIGTRLASSSLEALASIGVRKCHLFVLADNQTGAAFWRASGWDLRGDIAVYSRQL